MTLFPDVSGVDYTPDGTPTAQQDMDVYYPPHPNMPLAGWPVIVRIQLDDWDTSSKGASIAGRDEEYVRAGFAFVNATVTRAGDTATLGLFRDDSETEWGTEDTAEFDVMSIVQHLRANAESNGGSLLVDVDRIFLWGETGPAGTVCAWVAWNTDLAIPMHADAQRQESSKVKGVIARLCPTWFPAYSDAATSKHFRDETLPATQAATYGDAIDADLINASPIKKLVTYRGENRTVATYLRSVASVGIADEGIDSEGLPTLTNSSITGFTNEWFQRIAMRILRSRIDSVWHEVNSLWTADRPGSYPSDLGVLEVGADVLIVNNDGVGGWTSEKRRIVAFLRKHSGDPGAADTWDVPYEWFADTSVQRRGIRSNHAEQGAALGRQERSGVNRLSRRAQTKTWSVGARNAVASDIARIEQIMDNARTGAVPINFPSPDDEGYALATVNSDSFEYQMTSASSYSWSIEFEEASL